MHTFVFGDVRLIDQELVESSKVTRTAMQTNPTYMSRPNNNKMHTKHGTKQQIKIHANINTLTKIATNNS
jgi:hypothetical protein